MAGKTEADSPAAKPRAAPPGGSASWLALGAAGKAQADAFLHEQTILAREQARVAALQAKNLIEQDRFELSHLRWRAFNEKMKGAGQIMLVAAGLLIVVMVATAMWNASRARGLVVDTFTVPPSYAAAGLSGEVLADELTNAVGAIRDLADTRSLVRSEGVRQERDNDIRVEIPETGVSIDQAWRFLRLWLGHERRLRGSLRTLADGTIALTVALDGDRAFTLTGLAADLPKLEQQAAERIFEIVDPNNYVIWLLITGRREDCMAAVQRYANRPLSTRDHAAGVSLWGAMTRVVVGDLPASLTRARAASRIDPKLLTPHMEIMSTSLVLGHDEEALRQARLIPTFKQRHQPPSMRGSAFADVMAGTAVGVRMATGDFSDLDRPVRVPWGSMALGNAELASRRHDAARGRSLMAEALAVGSPVPDELNQVSYQVHAAGGDWPAAAADARAFAAPQAAFRFTSPDTTRQAVPLLAYALARAGDFAGAEAALAPLPLDCYACLRTRGQVAALQGQWASADAWFAKAIAAAPSIPYAYADRGEMLLMKGDPEAAIAQLTLANQKGPKYADALELWGEALLAKNQPKLAVAKFRQAERYAPNWGRLHLKWGQALAKLGKADQARAQFRAAAKLGLSPADRAELAGQKI
jgi:tetratricopeptide (TPR) repeat protein